MIQSILAEISQKRRIHLYPSLARDESVVLPDAAGPAILFGSSSGAAPQADSRQGLLPARIAQTINTLKNDNRDRFAASCCKRDKSAVRSWKSPLVRKWACYTPPLIGE
jgi:hypothetical protein